MDTLGSVTLCESDPGWPQAFARQRELVVQALGPQLLQIHHVGSTAIPGLAARPIIDMLVEVVSIESLEKQKSVWQKLKFELLSMTWGVNHCLLLRRAPYEPIDLHLYQKNDPQIRQWLCLQSYLEQQPSVCQLYARLKKSAALHSKGNRLQYELSKQRFLQPAFSKSCTLWEAREIVPRTLHHFMTTEQVAKRIWDSFCLYQQTLFRFSSHFQPLPYPGVLAWESDLEAASFSLFWRWRFLDEKACVATFRFLKKIVEASPKGRSAFVSPFDTAALVEPELKKLGFSLLEPFQFLLLPLLHREVYELSSRRFKRILHSQELYSWAFLLREETEISEWHELYTSLPLQLYAFGEAFEFYTLEEEGHVLGSCLLFFHKESVGLMEVRWKEFSHLQEILNMVTQRADALGYSYIHSYVELSRAEPFRKVGFIPLFRTNRWELAKGEVL